MITGADLHVVNLDDEIARFPPEDDASGRRAETLLKNDGMRVVLTTMRAGAILAEHTAPGAITIHALRGRFTVHAGDEERHLGPGELLAIAAGVRHDVQAIADGAFLLTMQWPSRLVDGGGTGSSSSG